MPPGSGHLDDTLSAYLDDELAPAARREAEELLAGHRSVAAALGRDRGPTGPGEGDRGGQAAAARLPGSLSATQAVGLLAERIGPAELLRPLPRRPSEPARIGVEIHRWIEEQARRLTGLADEEGLDAPSAPLEPSRVEVLKEQFRRMGFAERRLAQLDSGEPMAELPFILKVGRRVIRGRIDAVYQTGDGGLEIVDFKTGRHVDDDDLDQLAVYAAALGKLGVEFEEPLKVTYCYLADGSQDSRTLTRAESDAALSAMASRLQ